MRTVRGFLPYLGATGFGLLLSAASPAPDSAVSLYQQGDYLAAAEAAAAQKEGAGLALAARATLADETLRETRCMECLKRAEAYAREAIAADAKNAEGYIELAAALGYEARVIGPIRAQLAGFADLAKDAIEDALKLAPDDPWVLAAAGGWNIEVARTGGVLLGRLIYGASYDNGVRYFRRALSAEPANLTISLQYALALTSYAFEPKRTEIMAVLDATARGTPSDMYEGAMKERAVKLIDLLNRNKREEYRALAKKYSGFPSAVTDSPR